jgi:predicted DNA-binding transcriptional regulator YafY
MSKAKRLNEMIMMVNRKRRFTVAELAQEFQVSKRTVLRDLQELSEMGVPLYSEVGPHGGYQVLKERILPPIAFSEDEAAAIFFALHALRQYISVPFDAEYESIKKKFYLNLSGSIRDTIDHMKDRVDFLTAAQQEVIPHLKELLEAAIHQDVITIHYESKTRKSERNIQPIGIYAKEGHWYCPSYCFESQDYRVFRCDRINTVVINHEIEPIDLSHIHLKNRFSILNENKETYDIHVELTARGVERFMSVSWPNLVLNKREDGTGSVTGTFTKQDIDFMSEFFLSYHKEARIVKPSELIQRTKEKLTELLKQYE